MPMGTSQRTGVRILAFVLPLAAAAALPGHAQTCHPAATLTPGSPASGFGTSISMSSIPSTAEQVIAVGAVSGSVHIFGLDSTTQLWTERQVLTGPAGSRFGRSISLRGDTLAVGAPGEGKVYIIQRDVNGVWQVVQTLPACAVSGTDFGIRVALEGDDLAVQALPNHACIFNRGTGTFVQEASFTFDFINNPGDPNPAGSGWSLYQGRLAIGAPADDSNYHNGGAALLYSRSSGWNRETVPAFPVADNDFLGQRVSLGNGLMLASASGDDALAANTGAVYVFEESGGSWTQTTRFFPPPFNPNARFGTDLAHQGINAVVTATSITTPNTKYVFLFTRHADGNWDLSGQLRDPGSSFQSGAVVAINLNTIAVGAPASGAVYLYQGSHCPEGRGDFDRSGVKDVSDIFSFLDVWFATP